MTPPSKALARLSGLLIGCGLSMAIVASGHMRDNPRSLTAQLNIDADPAIDLTVSPSGRFISARNLKPGPENAAEGSVILSNGSAETLSVRARGLNSTTDLNRLLRIQISAGERQVFRGKLRQLRRWTVRSFGLAGRGRQRVKVRAWLPSSLTRGYRARVANITFEWKARVVGT
jgi:hypothetical protein